MSMGGLLDSGNNNEAYAWFQTIPHLELNQELFRWISIGAGQSVPDHVAVNKDVKHAKTSLLSASVANIHLP